MPLDSTTNTPPLCACGCGREFVPKKSTTRPGMTRYILGHSRKGLYMPLADRFWRYVRKTDGCWLWTGTLDRQRYGAIWDGQRNNRMILAHRASWEIHFGPIPEGMLVCHNCPDGDNPQCVNPSHLFLGTMHDNMVDMVSKGRMNSGHTKLTDDSVREIRRIYAVGGQTMAVIAAAFGVHRVTARDAIRGKSWTHVGQP